MDPQACLQRIIDSVSDHEWGETESAFADLGAWLKSGGFTPYATGPIFGSSVVAVGYPGMMLYSLPRHEMRPVRHVRSSPSAWRYAIMVDDSSDADCRVWRFVEYRNERTVASLGFPTD